MKIVPIEPELEYSEAYYEHLARTMGELQGRYPKTRFVHVTAPLTTVQRGLKAWLGHLFGKPA